MIPHRGTAGSSSCWRSRRCTRCRKAGWGRLRYPAAADPAAAEGTPPAGWGSPAGCSSDWRMRWRRCSLIGRGQSCYHWRLLGNRREGKFNTNMCFSSSVPSSSTWKFLFWPEVLMTTIIRGRYHKLVLRVAPQERSWCSHQKGVWSVPWAGKDSLMLVGLHVHFQHRRFGQLAS